MAGYPVIDPAGVDIYDEEGNLTHYDLGDTVPLSKLISRRYNWLVNRGYLSEVETDDWGSTVWGEISGTLSSQTDLQNALDAKLNLTGGTLTGDLTISKGSPNLSILASSGNANLILGAVSGSSASVRFKTAAGVQRWVIGKQGTSESGSNAGSNFEIIALDDAGSVLSYPLTITRSTGAVTLASSLTVGSGGSSITGNSTNSGNFTITNTTTTARVSASSGMSTLSIEGPAGQWRELVFKTGTSARWSWDVSTAAESGSNAGSNLALYRYNDAGGSIGTPILVDRATGLTTLSSLTVSGVSSFTGASSFTGQMSLVNGTPTTIKFAKASQWGYSSGYRAIVLGDTAGSPNNVTVSIGYDPVGNANGSFTGDGREVLFRNAVEFVTPNAANNAWLKPLKFDSTGNSTMLGLTLTGDLTVSKTNAQIYVNGGSGNSYMLLGGAAGYVKYNYAMTAGLNRWSWGSNATAESGTNAGSDFAINSFTDAGASLSTPLTITRSTGLTTLTSLTVSGTTTTAGVKKTLSTKTGAYTLTATDHIIVATSGTWNATLPTAASVAGTEYIIKNSGTGTITVGTTSSQTIDGSLTFGLNQYESITVVSDGANWVII